MPTSRYRRGMKTGVAHKSYGVALPMNHGKLDKLFRLLPIWRKGLTYSLNQWCRELFETGSLSTWQSTKTFPNYLSQRQWDSVSRQAKATFDSWLTNRQNEFRSLVYHSTLEDNLKRDLYEINLRYAWYEHSDDETHHMARWLMKHLRRRNRIPDLSKCRTMDMDGKIARIENAKNTKCERWAVVSTLESGKPVRVPILADRKLDENLFLNNETLSNHLTIRFNLDGSVNGKLITTLPKAEKRTQGETLGLDWGMDCMFALSDGRLLGTRMFDWLKQRDTELIELTRALQKNGVKPSKSRRYRNLQRRIRAYYRNEIGRLFNQLSKEQVEEIVVEKLDFRNLNLSYKMNRLLTRTGRAAVEAKLKRIQELDGVTVTEINPAYTSQQCSHCGYTARNNRPTRDLFRCKCCGTTLHADINASRNILSRRSRENGWRFIRKQEIVRILNSEHANRYAHHDNHLVGDAQTSGATPRRIQPYKRLEKTGVKVPKRVLQNTI